MIATIDRRFNEALALPDESLLQLVEHLVPTMAGDSALEAEQLAEASPRREEVHSVQVQSIPGERVFREVSVSLAARRSASA